MGTQAKKDMDHKRLFKAHETLSLVEFAVRKIQISEKSRLTAGYGSDGETEEKDRSLADIFPRRRDPEVYAAKIALSTHTEWMPQSHTFDRFDRW